MEKKQTFSVHTERDVKLTVEDIDDIMVAALEGGINYWCSEADVVEERRCADWGHEQIARGGALVALHALKEPREMCCGGCQRFTDEDANGVGWCEEHDREAYCDEPPCGYFE